jgi:hypothetical protein
MAEKSKTNDDNVQEDEANITNSDDVLKEKKKKGMKQRVKEQERQTNENIRKDSRDNNRNIVMFTGKALVEIMRDHTMLKSFLTLSLISDIMVGSEISPLQKQKLIKVVKQFLGEGQYVAAIIASPED